MTFPTIVCPVDLQPLTAQEEGWLVCANQHRYQTRVGIPRLVSSQVTYADAFGEQWKRYRTTQLDSYSRTSISKDRLRGCLGERLWSALQQPARMEILEAGCGAGRFTEVLLQLQAASVTSTDLSEAVEPNQVNCPQSDRHRIVQCDINAFPFAPSLFDLVLCIGVVQHTRDPERTIADLYRQVRPGGSLVIDHYTHNLSRYTKISSLLLRPILKRMSPATGVAVTEWLTKAFFPLHKMVRSHRLLQILLSRVSPLATYFQTIPELSDQLQYEWAVLDTHDGLTDYYQHLRSARQIERTLSSLGAVSIEVAEGGNGIEARCVKPT
jgi:2-polyprenyl-3-methyl-5-hydroxy-6-metoxy-1,4-benzoquinol methylase